MYSSRLLIPSKKVLTWTGIELESPRLPVGSADHSAIRHVPMSNPWIKYTNKSNQDTHLY